MACALSDYVVLQNTVRLNSFNLLLLLYIKEILKFIIEIKSNPTLYANRFSIIVGIIRG